MALRTGRSVPPAKTPASKQPALKPRTRPARALPRIRFNAGFAREIIAELRKVTWPSRQTVINLTIVVIVVSVAVGAFLGAFDLAFNKLFEILVTTR